jgi:asparagine synthase (glutamine-hydrolysing)
MAIAGIFSWSDQKVDQVQLGRMLDAGDWHGPDGRDHWLEERACLGFLRFHTTLEAASCSKPICLDDRWVLCLDGHLSNRAELCSRLKLEDSSLADSHLAYRAFLQWGRETPQFLVGDFTLVVWDRLKRELFCAQSPVGFRPLFWFFRNQQLAIGREISQLLTLPFVPKRINQGAAAEMCACRFLSQDETLLEGVMRVPPGATLVVGADGPKVGRWHRVQPTDCIQVR